MSQIQIQKTKLKLTPDLLFPKWSQYLDTGKKQNRLKRQLGINISDAQFCIVGESHGFSKKYSTASGSNPCNLCHKTCMESMFLAEGVEEKKIIDWRETGLVKSFVEHFELFHI